MHGTEQTPWKRAAAMTSALALLFLLAGCGQAPNQQPGSEPTMACPAVPHDGGIRGCAEYDPDRAMEENERYREQREISDETRRQLEADLTPVQQALERLPLPPRPDAVVAAFTDLGLGGDVQTDDNGNAVRFGAAVGDGGCITGYVGYDGAVTVDYGGTMKDGGCLAMSGH